MTTEPAGTSESRRLPLPARIYALAVLVLVIQLSLSLPQLLSDARCYSGGHRAYREGDYEAAIRCSREFLRRYPDSPEAQARLGISLFRQGHTEEGEAAMRQALSMGVRSYYLHEIERLFRSYGIRRWRWI